MRKNSPSVEFDSLAENASALIAATAHVAEDNVVEARKRLAATLGKGRDAWDYVRDKSVESARLTDDAIRSNPYQAIGVAFGLGALLSFLIARRE